MNRLRHLETFARAGWFARGVVYLLLGYLAIATGRGDGAGPEAAFRHVASMPAGAALLALLAVGLAFYGAFRLYGAAMDSDSHGQDAQGIAIRIGHVASGIAHFILAWSAVRLLSSGTTRSADAEAKVAGVVLDLPLGGSLLGVVGLAFLAAAVHQASKSWNASFLAGIDSRAPDWVKSVGQAGIAARALVFTIVGYSLMRAGWFAEASQTKGIDEVLLGLRGEPIIYALVALGLAMFGMYSFVEARWRRIRNEDVVARIKAAAR